MVRGSLLKTPQNLRLPSNKWGLLPDCFSEAFSCAATCLHARLYPGGISTPAPLWHPYWDAWVLGEAGSWGGRQDKADALCVSFFHLGALSSAHSCQPVCSIKPRGLNFPCPEANPWKPPRVSLEALCIGRGLIWERRFLLSNPLEFLTGGGKHGCNWVSPGSVAASSLVLPPKEHLSLWRGIDLPQPLPPFIFSLRRTLASMWLRSATWWEPTVQRLFSIWPSTAARWVLVHPHPKEGGVLLKPE